MTAKRSFTIILNCILIFFTLSSYAQQNVKSGSLQITAVNNEPIYSEITGPQYFKENVQGNIILSNLLPGEYHVKIYSLAKNGIRNLIANQIISLNSGKRTIASIMRNHVSYSTVFDDNSQSICVNTHSNVGQNNPPPFSHNQPLNHHGQQMNEKDFNKLYKTVEEAFPDKNKLNAISAAADYSMFSTYQIRQIMKLFSFDEGKLQCAKTMAFKTSDKHNLYSLAEEFSFSATKEKYFNFIKNNVHN